MAISEKEAQIFAEIIRKGGSVFMHPNDLERLKEAAQEGNAPDIFNGIKVCADQTGLVEEGKPVAAVPQGDNLDFSFRDAFEHSQNRG